MSISAANEWILDSGANAHISGTSTGLQNLQPCISPTGSVRLPNGNSTPILSVGSCPLSASCTLTKVLHVPDFSFNLLSISQFTKENQCCVVFYPTFCLFQALSTGKIMGIGRLRDGLYYLATPFRPVAPTNHLNVVSNAKVFPVSQQSAICNVFSSLNNNIDLWHKRFGHMSVSRLQCLPFIAQHKLTQHCPICPLAKQTRAAFPLVDRSTSSHIFQLVHMDIWGPYRHATHEGARYFLTLVDDFSRCTWAFLMQHKSDTLRILKHFFAFVSTQFRTHIQSIRTDNASEFFNTECNEFFKSLGVIHQSSCPYTPQQNGMVERKHRHILNVARALKFQGSIPHQYWGECVLHAVYLINRTPTPLLANKTPFEAMFQKTPTFDHIKVFGCLCYATNLRPTHKFDVRAKPYIFLGYPPHQKGYKLLDFSTNQFAVSRDVTFHESIFPFAHISSSSVLFPPCPTLHSDDDMLSVPAPVPLPNIIPSSPSPVAFPRRSSRVPKPPAWTKDFLCSATTTSSVSVPKYALSKYLSYSRISPAHRSFLASISHEREPNSFKEASLDPRWQKAMAAEIEALEANKTWIIVLLPPGAKPIGCRWIYKIKYNSDGSINKFKARLVAKGYTQQYGIDYQGTFSPVAKIVTVRCLLSLAAAKNWPLYQMDVTNAFLQGDLTEDIYMSIPQGFERSKSNHACKLLKSLYGLKQASRQWNSKFCAVMIRYGYTQSVHDHSLFLKHQDGQITLLLVYVDDIVITRNDSESITALKSYLHSNFAIKDLGILKYFLGLEVARSSHGICLNQRKYTLELLADASMSGCKPYVTPMEQHLKLTTTEYDEKFSSRTHSPIADLPLSDPTTYQRLIGRLIYLTITRPDICFVVTFLSQFMHAPKTSHLRAAERVLGYLKNSLGMGIFLSASSDLHLYAYCDSDWASCPMSRKSISGYLVTLGSSPISWKSKKQLTISRSSAEAEYRSMASTTCEIVWLRGLLTDMGLQFDAPTLLHCDNQSALHLAANPMYHERTKHIEIDCHFIREKIHAQVVATSHISTHCQPADIFTKALGSDQHKFLLSKLGMLNLLQA